MSEPIDLEKLADTLEKAICGSQNLDLAIHLAIGKTFESYLPSYTTLLDEAMSLLPETSVNHSLFSFIGHGVAHIGKFAWGFRFNDTTKLVGEERAKHQVKEIQLLIPYGDSSEFSSVKTVMVKAIAERYREFSCTHAATPALAICAAAIRSRID
jgi:hypothetical protein